MTDAMKLGEAFLRQLETTGGMPVAKQLSYLLRPAFIAEPGHTLVWGDFANIEARVLPWLAASPGAEGKLDIFRAVDADTTLPDVYMRTGAALDGRFTAEELWDAYKNDPDGELGKIASGIRQAQGKVPELSLGFGGGVGALVNMAINYGVYFDEDTGREVVDKWRDENRWAVEFWGKHNRHESTGLIGAFNQAIDDPGTIMSCGRVAFVFDPKYLGGSMLCALPCGRPITYASIRRGKFTVTDKDTGKKEEKHGITYHKDYGRKALWHGTIAENITQGYAASVLRRTLVKLEYGETCEWMPPVGHTHDEAMVQCAEDHEVVTTARKHLHDIMVEHEDYDADLPLAADITSSWYYSKSVKN